MAKAFSAEAAVVGGGPAGLVTALALAAGGLETLLIAPTPPPDRRTTALLDGSVEMLKELGAWPALAPEAAPLKYLRLVDATNRILRAPEVVFHSAELGLEAFGYNVENARLREQLFAACRRATNLRIVEAAVIALEFDDCGATLKHERGEERVRLVAAADGRTSPCRAAAGIEMHSRALPQTAIALNLRHSHPHHDTSTEFHTESGPFTLVPLKGHRSSLVCVVTPGEAEMLNAMSDAELGREVERRAHSILGKVEIDGPRGIFPLMTEKAERLAARRVALVGEAGHVLPPIGAQGLNLGFRDAHALAELVTNARHAGRDPGGDRVLEEYDARRRGDVRTRSLAVELANGSLMSDFLPVHAARGLGLHLAARVGFFRKALMRQGLGR
ncbi:MAG TPA: UbiH/UbiF family hydroxylase [Xanthobacteraceae bacterium]|nr:UbiH/UbiF family hydroxylase [Xanthobacteraceae bacterium]